MTKKDGTYQFAATTKDGTKVWANNQGNAAQIPTKTSSADWTVTAAQNGQFNLKTDDGYLYFYTDRQKNYFDRVHSIGSNQEQCEFSLYRPAMQGDNASEQVSGFVQTTQVDEIKDGERYLIAAERNGEVYVMRPSSASSADDKFDHVLKVDPTAKMTNTVLESEVVLTAKANGTTQVEIDKVTYHITVANPSHPDDSGTSSNDVVGRETITNPDGSVTVTEIRRDGTVIKTTKDPVGNVTVVETRKDGSIVVEVKKLMALLRR